MKQKKKSCCRAWWNGIGGGDWGSLAFQRDLHFDRVPEVLAPAQRDDYLRCRQAWYDKEARTGTVSFYPEYFPFTFSGTCNFFGCHCE